MLTFILRRLFQSIPVLLGVWSLVFVLFNCVGGDPTYLIVGKHANAQQIAEVRHQMGYDQPLLTQYFQFLKGAATFDYGVSRSTHQPISQMIVSGVEPSLSLMIPAFFLMTFIAVTIGLLTAYFRGSPLDRSTVIFCVLGMSISMLAYILFGQYFLAYRLGWFPISGYEEGWWERWDYLGLPILIWIIVSLGYDVRYYRTALLEEMGKDYVRTARAKGLSDFPVLFKHVLKNGMIPIITNVVIEIPLLVLGSFLLENFFGIPGLGGITVNAIHNSDLPVIQAMTTTGSMAYLLGNLATDVFYALFDPRVRLG